LAGTNQNILHFCSAGRNGFPTDCVNPFQCRHPDLLYYEVSIVNLGVICHEGSAYHNDVVGTGASQSIPSSWQPQSHHGSSI